MKLWQISTKICTVDSPGPGVFWIQNPNGKSKRSLAVAEKWKWVDIISTETIENEPQIIRAHGVVLVAYLHACSAYWEGSIWIQSADRSRTLGTAGYSWVHMSGVNNNNSITTGPGVPTLAHTGQHNYYVVSSDLTAHYTLPLHTSVGSRDTWLVLTLTPAHDHLTTMVRTLSLQ